MFSMFGYTCSRRQFYTLVVGWAAYASTYLLRKPLGVVKTDLQSDLNLSTNHLGWLDTALILPYAVTQMILGPIGDKIGSRRTYGTCLFLSGLSMISFGYQSSFTIMLVLLFLNGATQSLCWPNSSKIIASWFSGPEKKTVFGIYGTSAFAGGIVGTSLTVYLMTQTAGWRSCFVLPSVIVIIMGFIVFFTLFEAKELHVTDSSVPSSDSVQTTKPTTSSEGWLQLCKISLVPEVSVSVFCLKLIRYCMYMWLPMYLHKELNYSKAEAGMFSTMFDIGGVAGSAFVGIIINRLFRGRMLRGCMVMMALSTVMLVMFTLTASWGTTINSILMALAGALNCGPDSILVGLIPVELGEKDGRNAAAAVTGLVNGFGSLGSVAQGPIVGFLVEVLGWSWMLHFMTALSMVGTVVLIRASAMERREADSATGASSSTV